MKTLRFLWGFICGAWTLIVAVAAYLMGAGTACAVTENRRNNYRVNYDSTYSKGA